MECNCSNNYCASKLPAGSVVKYDENKLPVSIRVIRKGSSFMFKDEVKIISFDEWAAMCDNMGCDTDGVRWTPYVLIA